MKYVGLYITAGVVAAAGIGVAIYEAFKKPTVQPNTPDLTAGSAATPTVAPTARYTSATGGATFSATNPPVGTAVTVSPGQTMALTTLGAALNLQLPDQQSHWLAIGFGDTASGMAKTVNLGLDLKSGVSLSDDLLVGATMAFAKWVDNGGNTTETAVTFPKMVKVKPLVL
jgi:hypothetical protein